MMRIEVRYTDTGRQSDLVAVHPVDEMRAKRELAGKPYADDEYRMYYVTWLASRRMQLAGAGPDFDAWLAALSEVEPRLSRKQIDDAVLAGAIDADQAEALKAQITAQEEHDQGESQAPPSLS